jgi:hypothetical protein
VFVQNCTISGNSTTGDGGGISQGGTSTLTVLNSTLSGNTAGTSGGGISMSTSTLNIAGSSLTGNTATSQGAALALTNVNTLLDESTISGNSAGGTGGGIQLNGTLNISGNSTTVILNSTIAFNTAAGTGGGINFRGVPFISTLTLLSTIVSNDLGAGAANDLALAAGGTINASNSLIMTPPAPGVINGTNSGNLFGVDPLLGPLQNNGGPTLTMALLPGSPAIDAGSNPGKRLEDQRGFARVVGAAADIGAFEVQPAIAFSPTTLPPAVAGQPYSQTVTAGGGAINATTGAQALTLTFAADGALPPGLTFAVNGNTLTISGTPARAGSVGLVITATDRANTTASAPYALTVNAAPAQTSTLFAVGAGPGGKAVVDVYDSATGAFKYQFQAFETGFTGGVRVAVARDGSGRDIIAVAAGPGGFLVRTFVAGPTGVTNLGQIQPFGTFTGGIFVALGDLQGNGQLEVVCGADADPVPGGDPNYLPIVNVWNLAGTMQLSPNVPAFEKGFHGGVRVAVGDVDGSGKNEIVATAGPGGFAFVEVINGQTFKLGNRFDAFDQVTPQGLDRGFKGGVTVATGILDASGIARILVGADAGDNNPNDAPVMRTFDNTGKLLVGPVFAFEPAYPGGVNVATSLDGRGRAWVLATPARAHNPQIDIFSAGFNLLQTQTITDAVTKVADANFATGVSVGG